MDLDWKGEPVACPGYTTNLPEVIEIARARVHAKEFGGLRDFCEGYPTEAIKQGVEILEGASNECQQWSMANPEKR